MQNDKIKEIKKLKSRRYRDDEKLFLIEGYREILKALKGNIKIKTLFFSKKLFLKDNEDKLISQINANKYSCSKDIFEKISYRDRPDGLLAIAFYEKKYLKDLSLKKNPFLIVAEKIEKPGNLGTILRSCDGAGVDALIVCDPVTDIYNPNVVRASIGSLFTNQVVEAEKNELISFLKKNNINIVAATPNSSLVYTQADFKKPTAIIVGSEQYGLTLEWLQLCNVKVKIPMKGCADSLNVATATTILLYEILRQRS